MLYKDFVREKTHHLTKIKSAEGYPCVFDNSKGKALKNYKVYGNSTQDGTPTPESPVEIQSVGDLITDETSENFGKYKVSVTVGSKNIFGGTAFRDKLMELGGTLDEKNKTVTIGADKLHNKVLFDKFDANKRYTFIFRGYNTKTTADRNYGNIQINYSGTTKIGGIFNSTPGTKGTWYYKSLDGLSVAKLIGYWSTGNTVFYYEECGIFEGAISLSEFEPSSRTQTDIFLDEPMRKFSTYSDYIDFKRQKVIRKVGYYKITADKLKSLTNSVIAYATSKPNSALGNGMSTIGSYSAKYGYTDVFHWYVSDAGNLFLFAPTEDMTLEEYFTNLDIQTDVEFIWATSALTEETITLPPILTLKDNNIITTNATVTPSNIEVKYVAK